MWQPYHPVLQPHKQPHIMMMIIPLIMTMIHTPKYKAVALTSPCMGVVFFICPVFEAAHCCFSHCIEWNGNGNEKENENQVCRSLRFLSFSCAPKLCEMLKFLLTLCHINGGRFLTQKFSKYMCLVSQLKIICILNSLFESGLIQNTEHDLKNVCYNII